MLGTYFDTSNNLRTNLTVLIGPTVAAATITTTAFGEQENGFGRFEILDEKDPNMVEIGQFVIDEHKKLDNATLQFQSVVKALRAILKYILVIQAEDGTTSKKYRVIVEEQGTQKTLNDFEET
ncbi:unnamed protein product [Fraxinus pennsylvanica]|uniref:Cystatin domain-containing protein n=1 Tax=Fraxinus pennsylvanica TaxID=56036 RepID=A0AAD1YVC2_9LAMI|nr:unnamed protein product [Fraxinus pennsylvanica]